MVVVYGLLLLPSIFPSIRVFSNESVLCIRWPKYWSFSFSISPSNEYPGLIFCRIDWFDLPTFQGTLKSFLQHRSSKASILWHSAFFIVHLSHPYMTTGKFTEDLLSPAPLIRTRPSFPLSQSLPPGSFHKPLILIHQRADRLKTIITEN